MEVKVEEIGPCKKKISIEIPATDIKEKYEKKVGEFAKSFQLPGFRVGHVPRHIIEKKVGENIVEELKSNLIQDAYKEVLEKHKLLPLAQPEIDEDKIQFNKESPLIFDVIVEVKPDFEIGEYKNIKVTPPPLEVTEEEINKTIENVRHQQAELIPVESGKAGEEDQVICDINLKVEDKNVWGSENIALWIKDTKVPGKDLTIEKDLLKDVSLGEIRQGKVLIPSSWGEEYQDKQGEISIAVKEIKRIELPQVNEEFFKTLNCKDLDELKSEIKEQLLRQKKAESETFIEDEILNKLIESTKIELPEGVIEKHTAQLLKQRQKVFQEEGISEEENEKIKHEIREQVIRGAKESLILEKIAKLEKIFALEREVEDHINAIAASQRKWPNEVRQYYESNEYMDDLRMRIRDEKTRKFLRENAVIEKVENKA